MQEFLLVLKQGPGFLQTSTGPGMQHMGRHGWPSRNAHENARGAADAHDAGPPAEKKARNDCDNTLKGAADAHDVGSGASGNVRQTQTTL